MTDVKHFEQLWEEAEELAIKIHGKTPTNAILTSIQALINEYADVGALEASDEVKKSLKNRHMGELVFLLTAISIRDNINVYEALMEEIKIND